MEEKTQSPRGQPSLTGLRIVFAVNVDYFFLSHRLPLALAARDAGMDVWVVAGETDRRSEIESYGLGFMPIAISRKSTNPIREAKLFAQLLRVYVRLHPHIVHQVSIKPVLYGSLAARIIPAVGVVNGISGFGYALGLSGQRRVLRAIVMTAYRAALSHPRSLTIFQNSEDRKEFVEKGLVPCNRAILIRGSGVDRDHFAPTLEPEDSRIVMFAGRLIWEKGVAQFVEAARILKGLMPELRFVVVGSPDEDSPQTVSRDVLSRWAAEGLIEWWGPRGEMPAVLSLASIVVLPTYYREGVPKILIEAAAVGRAIVATDTPGCRDIVRHRENGLLVPPKDVNSLVDAIRLLMSSPSLRSGYGQAGRTLVEREFRIELVVAQTLEAYRTLADQIRTSPQPNGLAESSRVRRRRGRVRAGRRHTLGDSASHEDENKE